MEIIRQTAFDEDELPEIDIGGGFAFFGNIIKSVYLFIVAVLIAVLPFVIIAKILESVGMGTLIHLNIFVLAGLVLFPIVILTIAASPQLWYVFRPGYIFMPIIRAPFPYLVPTVLVIAAVIFQWLNLDYGDLKNPTNIEVALQLLANIGVQILMIIAMRSIGLFCRHYSCYLPWR